MAPKPRIFTLKIQIGLKGGAEWHQRDRIWLVT
jgi:hypothetical protein